MSLTALLQEGSLFLFRDPSTWNKTNLSPLFSICLTLVMCVEEPARAEERLACVQQALGYAAVCSTCHFTLSLIENG